VLPFDDFTSCSLPQLSHYPYPFSEWRLYRGLLQSASISGFAKSISYIRVVAYVFCPAGVSVCLFVITCEFCMMSSQLSYRILNCIMKFWFLLFGFYLSLGIPQFLFKVFCCSYYFVYSFLFGIYLCRLLL